MAMAVLEVESETEAEIVDTVDYFFERIGDSVPVMAPPFNYGQAIPSQPLAVSQLHGLLFLALPSSSGQSLASLLFLLLLLLLFLLLRVA